MKSRSHILPGLFLLISACTSGSLSESSQKLVDESAKNVFDASVASLRVNINLTYATSMEKGEEPQWLQTLDSQADGPCQTCFSTIKNDGIAQKFWSKSGNSYIFKSGGFTSTMTYDPTTGEVSVPK